MRFAVRAAVAGVTRTLRRQRGRSVPTASRNAFAAAWFSALLIGIVVPCNAEPGASGPQRLFDIPGQDIDRALEAYTAVTGLQILYEPAVTRGRRSTAVNGTLTPEAALSVLLAGSGLDGRRSDIDAVVVVAAPPPPVDLVDSGFLGALQAGIMRGLCRDERTRPGAYRAAIQIWLTRDGAVRRIALLGPTGEARRDAALLRAFDMVVIRHVPAHAAETPLTLTITPGSSASGASCGQ